ncbi:MAG: VCBS repeat-containing protein, partial [Halioglobus sp.]|nr:VCBS repeat-containing protein [Halioglobus sp.]
MKFFHRYKIGLVMISCLGAAAPSYAPNIYWQKWAIDTNGNGADGVYTGDINRDGLVDVVSGWEQSGDLRLYLNPGPATVRQTAAWSHVDISDGIAIVGIEDAAFADLDLDGFYDAVISSREGDTRSLGLHWLAGDHLENPADWRGVNLVPAEHSSYMKARAAQIDGMDGADIVAGTRNLDAEEAGIYWFRAPPGAFPGNASQWQRFYIGKVDVKTVTLVIKDMDADGLADIVFAGRNGVGWFRNPGHWTPGGDPARATWERIMITARGSEFTFCD